MALLTLRDIQLSFGAEPLLDKLNLVIEEGERLCLVGRNGSGKSTLLKIIAGELTPDDGSLEGRKGLRVARLIQEVPGELDGDIFNVVAGGLGEEGRLLAEHHVLAGQLDDGRAETLERFQQLQERIEAVGAWDLSQKVETVLSRMELAGDAPFTSLSGGMKRRVLLARALVQDPDILLLDEPTNHLDIAAIQWLEDFLRNCGTTLVFITHDRALVRSLATRIIELDRGRLSSWPGNYDQYLEARQAALEAEERANAEFDKKLSREEAWIRQGIKARRTRNQGRVRELQAMRREHASRRSRQGTAKMDIQAAESSGKLVVEAEHITHGYEGQTLLDDFSTTIFRGDRIGVIGPNGCGKSTLLKILLGRLEPQHGRVRHGTRLDIARFDQLRETLDEQKTVVENVAEGSDVLTIDGKPKHVMGYLQDFLFEPGRARQPVSSLSGGERNRLLLARLFTRPFNMLVLDEPTNDLDTETLELLEEQLMNFGGTLLLVSHDREFLDNVVTRTIVFEQGQVNEYVGGYMDWLRQRPETAETPARSERAGGRAQQKNSEAGSTKAASGKKLRYAEKLELQELPGRIEALENELQALQQRMAEPEFYQGPGEEISAARERLAELEAQLEETFARWEALDRKERELQ